MKAHRVLRACALLVLLAGLTANLFFTFRLWVVRDIDFIRTHRGLSAFDRIFGRYPPLLGDYVRFLTDALPPDAVLLLPPGGYPFDMAANTTFLDYFLKPRRVLTANGYDRRSGLAAWAVSRGVTHIAVPRGTDLYRQSRRTGPERNVEANVEYLRRVGELRFSAAYMPETVSVEARGIELVMGDGASLDLLRMGAFALLAPGMLGRESAATEASGEGGVRIAARYSGRDGAVSPEDRWGVGFGRRVNGVRAVRAELKSTSPASVCLWAEAAVSREWRLLRSEFNATDGEWQTVEIRAPDVPGGLSLRAAGLCIRPLGWGVLEVSERAAAERRR